MRFFRLLQCVCLAGFLAAGPALAGPGQSGRADQPAGEGPEQIILERRAPSPGTSRAGSGPADFANPSIAVVDFDSIFVRTLAAISIREQLEQKRETHQAELAAREAALREDEEALLEEREALDAEAFAARRRDLELRFADLQADFMARTGDLDQRSSAAWEVLQDAAYKVIARIAEAREISIVLSKNSVVIAARSLEITGDVIDILDQEIPEIALAETAPSE